MSSGYGCSNCKYHKVYRSYDYWSPDEHECEIPKSRLENPDFEITDEQADDIFTRVWENGEEWEHCWEQICPYYKEHVNENYF